MTPSAATPYCPTWSLHAWKPIFWQLDRIPSLQLRHLGTHVTQRRSLDTDASSSPDSGTRGHTLWAHHAPKHGDAALAWEWVCDEDNEVVLLSDPYGIVSNLRFVGHDDEVLTAFHATLHLCSIVQSLPWTDEVLRCVYGKEFAFANAA